MLTNPKNLPAGIRKKLEAEREQFEVPLADSFHTAPGWRILGSDFYTCVIPPHMAVDRVTLRRIHEFDPGLIPMVRKQRYLPPGSDTPVTVSHFALGRHVRNPRNRHVGFYVEMPLGAKHPRPNVLEAVLEERDLQMLQEGGPGKFQRFGPWLYLVLRAQFLANKTGRQWLREQQRTREEREARERRFRADEMQYRGKGMERLHRRAAELGPADWQRYWDRMRALRNGKPRVFLGGH